MSEGTTRVLGWGYPWQRGQHSWKLMARRDLGDAYLLVDKIDGAWAGGMLYKFSQGKVAYYSVESMAQVHDLRDRFERWVLQAEKEHV